MAIKTSIAFSGEYVSYHLKPHVEKIEGSRGRANGGGGGYWIKARNKYVSMEQSR